jgi:peptide deformylase
MGLRTIITDGDETLRKKSKEVSNFGERTRVLLDDMWETMREADGIGLAAPQVGVLRRAVVIDVTEAARAKEGEDEDEDEVAAAPVPGESTTLPVNAPGGTVYELLNPEIIRTDGEALEKEGCLSVPGVLGVVLRPERVTVKALDRDGNETLVTGEGLLAKALCHEIDHLDGILFTDIAEEIVSADADGQQTEDE